MKLSNEEIAKVFAMYIGCDFVFSQSSKSLTSTGVTPNWVYDLHQDKYVIGACKLLLTPLSEISDEDAVEVAEIVSDYWDKTLLTEKIFHGKRYAQRALFIPDGAAPDAPLQLTIHGIYIYQYLISHGYAVPLFFAPKHWANGKTPLDLGIAISKNEVK